MRKLNLIPILSALALCSCVSNGGGASSNTAQGGGEALSSSSQDEERRRSLGIDPVINSDNGTLTYGLYPQTHVKDEDTIESLNALTSAERNGWYLLDGEYYAKKEASPYDSSYVFDDGTRIVSGTTYWFKCEPITWKILSSNGGEYSLVSSALLDAHRFNAYWDGKDSDGYYANNYARSEIRGWLNGGFCNSAFALADSIIQTTTVDNSAATTDSSSNSYACESTEDKAYLLSYQDYCNTEYFADDEARQCKTTDWARANGAYCYALSSYLYNGWYWTRSPHSYSSFCAWFVVGGGTLYSSSGVYAADRSVRPAITVKLAQ